MANCPYFTTRITGYNVYGCMSDKHPKFSKDTKAARLGEQDRDIPKQCKESGKGCPFYKK